MKTKTGLVGSDKDQGLFQDLRVLRKRLADEMGVPPFIVFGDAALWEMAMARPKTLEEFGNISGVGEKKLTQFGQVFLAEISAKSK